MAVLVPTGRDPDRPAELAPTQRPDVPAAGDAPLSSPRLPDGCQLVCWLDVSGAGETDRVASVRHGRRRRKARPRILKLYRPGIEIDPDVHRAWRSIDAPDTHVVRLHDSGVIDGRAFEVMDDVGDRVGGDFAPPTARRTTLRDLLAEHPGGLPETVVVDLVRQLGGALAALGQARLAHLDLRPDNVLVTRRAGEAEGWDATLVDLGLAVPIVADEVWDVARPFSACLAPELLLAKTVTAATDWWSLGILAAELATGGHPLLGLDQRTVQFRLAGDDIPWPDGLPDRFGPLVRGLVAAGPRWGPAEVADWVAGTPPPPPPRRTPSARPFEFAGQEFEYVPQLMSELQYRWDEAAAVLFGPDADRWDELKAWLPRFDRPGFAAKRIIEHVERPGEPPWSAHARLLVLLRQADPGLPPAYRDVPVDREGIRRPDVVKNARFADTAEDLWRWRLLTELDGAAGARGYRAVDELWRELDVRWCAVAEVLREHGGQWQVHLAELSVRERRAGLLRVATDERFRAELRHGLVRVRAKVISELGTPLAWFEELAAMVLPAPRPPRGRRPAPPPEPDELVGLLMLHLVSPFLDQEVADEAARRKYAAENEAMRTVAWRRRERWREFERPVAMGWAVAAMGIVFITFAAVLIGGDAVPPRSLSLVTDNAISRAWGFVVVGLAGQTACEVWLAASIGAPYHRDHSLSTTFLRLAGRAGRRFGTGILPAAVFLVAALSVAAGVLAVLLVAPYVLMAPMLVVHIRSALLRHRRWRVAHDELRDSALEAPMPLEGQRS